MAIKSLTMGKSQLRSYYKSQRAALSTAEVNDRSIAIANRALEAPIWDYSVYHLFLSIEKQKEVNTEFLMHALHGKDKDISVSKSDFKTLEMTHYLLTDSTVLKVNKWGIPEPENGLRLQPNQIEVAFIPLLAFDRQGNRVGYGKGFYDRFLKQCNPDILKIGLSFFEAEASPIPTNPYDQRLDYCITPEKIYAFSD